jgi:hypothetical protein
VVCGVPASPITPSGAILSASPAVGNGTRCGRSRSLARRLVAGSIPVAAERAQSAASGKSAAMRSSSAARARSASVTPSALWVVSMIDSRRQLSVRSG